MRTPNPQPRLLEWVVLITCTDSSFWNLWKKRRKTINSVPTSLVVPFSLCRLQENFVRLKCYKFILVRQIVTNKLEHVFVFLLSFFIYFLSLSRFLLSLSSLPFSLFFKCSQLVQHLVDAVASYFSRDNDVLKCIRRPNLAWRVTSFPPAPLADISLLTGDASLAEEVVKKKHFRKRQEYFLHFQDEEK